MDSAPPRNHPEHSHLHAYLTGTLKEPYATELAKHLDICDECVELLARWIQEGVGQPSISDAMEDSCTATNITLARLVAEASPDAEDTPVGENLVPPTLNIKANKKSLPATPALADSARTQPKGVAEQNLDKVFDENTPTAKGQKGNRPDHPGLDADRLVGDYQLHEEIGRGGMSVVYRAVDLRLKRPVALKMLLSGSHATTEEMSRFRSEAETIARLRHEGIVQIYEVGEHETRPFLVLELVEGGSLVQFTQRRPQSPKHAAQMIATLACAIEYAHQQGIIHRDLKPSNVLLALKPLPERGASHDCSARDVFFGKEANEGYLEFGHQPKVTDFGLAKQLDAFDDRTRTGMVLGTPSYMSPEQAEGDPRAVGPSADIYGLGAILYELLTGRPPFLSDNSLETMRMVSEDDPVPPRKLQPSLSRDLETICLKCLAKEPRKRYPSAQELGDDLNRFLNQEPIVARPAGAVERTIKWTRRHPTLAGLILVTFFGILGVVGAWHQAVAARNDAINQAQYAHQAREAANQLREIAESQRESAELEHKESEKLRRIAEEQKQHAERDHEKVQHQLVTSYLARWTRSMEEGDSFGGLAWLRRAWAVEETILMKGSREYNHRLGLFRARGTMVLENSPRLVGYWSPRGGCVDAHFSPDGRHVVVAAEEQPLRVWDVTTGTIVTSAITKGSEGVLRVAYDPDGHFLATADADGHVKLWDLRTGKYDRLLEELPRAVSHLAFSPNGRRLAVRLQAGGKRRKSSWCLFDTQTKKGVGEGSMNSLTDSIEFSSDSRYLVGNYMWDARNGKRLDTPFRLMTVSRDGKRGIAETRTENVIAVVDTSRVQIVGRVPYGFSDGSNSIHRVACHADGQLVALCSVSGEVRIYRVGSENQVCAVQHKGVIRAMAFSPCGRYLATAGEDTTVRIWHTHTGTLASSTLPHESGVLALEFHPEGQQLLTRTDKGVVRVWEFPMSSERKMLPQPLVRMARMSPTGKRLVTVGESAEVKVWDAKTYRPLPGVSHYPTDIKQVSFSIDGRRFLLRTVDGLSRILDSKTGRPYASVGQNLHAIGAELNVDGTQLLYRRGHEFNLFDLTQERDVLIARVAGGHGFTRDGRYLVTGEKGHWNLWNSKDGKFIRKLPMRDRVRAKKIVLGKKWMVLTDERNHVQIRRVGGDWSVVSEFDIPPCYQILFSPNERTVLVRAYDGTLRTYQTKSGALAAPIIRPRSGIHAVAYSPPCKGDSQGGRWLLTGSEDGCVRLLNSNDLVLAGPLWRHGSPIIHVEFHPNGREVMSLSKDGQLRIWSIPETWLPTDDLAKVAELFPVKITEEDSRAGPLSTTDWEDLRQRFPRYLQASPKRHKAWIENELHVAVLQHHRAAERFYLQKPIADLEVKVAKLQRDKRSQEAKELAAWYTQRGLVHHKMGDYQQAAKSFALAGGLVPQWPDPKTMEAWSLACLGRHAEALQVCANIPKRAARRNIMLLLVRSLIHADKGEIERADELYLEAARTAGWSAEPKDVKVPFVLRIVRQRNSLKLLRKLCAGELRRRTDVWWLWRAEGLASAFLGRSKLALACWDRVLSLKKDDIPTFYNMSRLLVKVKDHREAANVCGEALRSYPDDTDLWRLKIAIRAGYPFDREGAKNDFEQAVAAGVRDPQTYIHYAEVLMSLKEWESAIEQLRKSIRPPGVPLATLHLVGLVSLLSGDTTHYSETKEALFQFGKKNPVLCRVGLRIGVLNPHGNEDWNDYLKLIDKNSNPLRNLTPFDVRGALLLRSGQVEAAEQRLRKTVGEPRKATPQNCLLLALVCHRRGLTKESKTWAKKAYRTLDRIGREESRIPWVLQLEYNLLEREFRKICEKASSPGH